MARVTVLDHGVPVGEVELYPAQRLFALGMKAGLDRRGFGDCGGQLVCASCHVRVKQGTFAPMKDDEAAKLDTLPLVYPDSRLACQLMVGEQDEVAVDWVGEV